MGAFGIENSVRPGYLLFFILSATSIILGFNYLREMNQRIQFQQNLEIIERQKQHYIVERSIIQRKVTQLQTQLENTNKEMQSFKDFKEFKIEEMNDDFENEKNDLLQTISSKDEQILEVQDQYESLKQQFENLNSVMRQFERNQSRLLEKFSTQSTQCMNVINMISELCKKGKNKLQKIEEFTIEDSPLNTGVTEKSVTENSSFPHPEETVKLNNKSAMELFLALQNKDDNPRGLIDIQDLQALGYESENPAGIGDNEAEETAQEKLYSLGKEKTLTSPKAVSQSIAAISTTKNTNVTFQTSETAMIKSDNKSSSLIAKQDGQTLEYEAKNTTSIADEEENDTALEKTYSLKEETVPTSQKTKTPQENKNNYDDIASQKSTSMLNKTKHTFIRETLESIALPSDNKQDKQGTEDNQEDYGQIFSPGHDKGLTSQQKEPQDGNDNKISETRQMEEQSHITNNSTAQKQTKMKVRTNTERLPDLFVTLESDKNNSKDGKWYNQNFSERKVNALRNGSLQLIRKDIQATHGNIFVKEDVANGTKTNITLSADKNLKEKIKETLKVNLNPQKQPLEKIKTLDEEVYKTQGKVITENIFGENDKEDEDNILALSYNDKR